MKRNFGKRALSLFLALVLCLSLMPAMALAGSQDWLEAMWYDNNRPEGYGFGTNDGTLTTDASGGISLSVSAFVSVTEDCTISGVYMVDASTYEVCYDLLNESYGAECDNLVDSYENPDTGLTEYSVSIWMQNIAIPNAVLGNYRLKLVTSKAIYYSEAHTDGEFSTDGIVRVTDGSAFAGKPVIKTSSLNMATLGAAYSAALDAEPYVTDAAITWSLTDGALPSGLTLSDSGIISGTPTAAGSFNFTVQAAEANGDTAERRLYLFVTYPSPVITTASLPEGRVGEAYSAQLEATPWQNGGELKWSLSSGTLPEGLSLSESGLLSGTPTAEGVFSFVPMVTETATGVGAGRGFTVNIGSGVYAVRFSLNGGSGAPEVSYDTISVPSSTSITLPAAPIKQGYAFAGWLCKGETKMPGASVTVSENLSFTAQWTELPDVSVVFPSDAEAVVGSLWLVGTYDGGQTEIIRYDYYSTPAVPENMTIPQWHFYYKSYTKLELCAYVDDRGTVIAEYDGAVTSGSGTITLRKKDGVSYFAVKGLEVEGLSAGSDYSSAYVYGAGRSLSFPCLISSADNCRVRLYGSVGGASYELYDWGQEYVPTLTGTVLAITPKRIAEPSVTVTGTITLGGEPVSGAVVNVSQYYKGMTRALNAVTDADGAYSVRIYPGAGATFTVVSKGSQLGGTTYLTAQEGTEARHDIALTTAGLQYNIDLSAASDDKLVSRYLSRLNAWELTVTRDGKKDDYSIDTVNRSRALTLYSTAAATGTLTCTLRGESIAASTQTAELSGGTAEVRLTPTLASGVLVRLSAQVTGSYFLAWYDATGAFIGGSRSFTLSGVATDFASVCPAAVKEGSFVVVLVSDAMRGLINLTTLANLEPEQAIKVWPVTLAERSVAELESYTVDTVTSRNALYATQPASTLYSSAESFADETDLIVFSGSIGLDSNLTNGKLMTLILDTRSVSLGYASTAAVQAIVIGGKLYEPYVDWNVGLYGSYSVDLHKGISLPCDYTIYCKPGNIDMDMHISITANGTYEGGLAGRGAFQNALVGTAVVSRPGATIYTLSNFVCSDTIKVSGTARRGEEVSIYDNGVLVGTARGGTNGSWTAQVALFDTDKSERMLSTAHVLTTVTSSGITSDELVVVHQADGPELKNFRMRWGGREINVGDSYTYAGGMQNTTFIAAFEHPEMLEEMPEWGENVRVVFKVWTTDGELRFLPATSEGPEFTATIDGVLRTSVTRAEAMFSPKWPRSAYDEAEGCYIFDSPSTDRSIADILTEFSGEAVTPEDVRAMLDGALAENGWSITFDGTSATFGGALSGAEVSETLNTAFGEMRDLGLEIDKIEQRCGDDTLTTPQWIGSAASYADETTKTVTTGGVRLYKTEEDLRLAEAYAASHAEKVSRTEDGSVTSYLWTDISRANDDTAYEGTYLIGLSYYRDAEGYYTERIDATFSEGFTSASLNWEVPSEPVILRKSLRKGGGDQQTSSEPPAPSVEQQSSAKLDAQGFLGDFGNTFGNYGVGDWGNTLSMLSNITTWLKPLDKMAGPGLGLVGGILGIFSLEDQRGSLEKTISKMAYEDGKMLAVLFGPCVRKLDKEEKDAVWNLYKDWCWKNAFRSNLEFWHLALNTEMTTINTIILYMGLAGSLETAGISAVGAAGITTVTTGVSVFYDNAVQKHLAEAERTGYGSYEKTRENIESIIRAHAHDAKDPDCEGKNSKDGSGKSFTVSNDPSGIVYEGVIENPVAGAVVTLWYAVDAEGYPVREETAALASELIPAEGVSGLIPQEATQITDENGFYQWGVPEGLWYVTAEYAGLTGSSDGDSAAVIRALDRDLLPVLPPQLDVNIPLTDYTAPMIEAVRCTTDGVFVTFTKYMTEQGSASVLDSSNFFVYTVSDDAKLTITSVTSEEQGHAPSNRYADEKTYTRTVRLCVDGLAEGAELRIFVAGAVESYAGTAMGADYVSFGTVEATETLDAPTISPTSGTVERGSEIAITAAEGTIIYYTTDGTEPSRESQRYLSPFAITNDMTVKAVVVRAGFADSAVSEAVFKIATGILTVAARVVTEGGGDADGLTLTLGGYTAKVEGDTAVFHSVEPNGYNLSFAGNSVYKPASTAVTVANNSVVLVLSLEKEDEKPKPEPQPYYPIEDTVTDSVSDDIETVEELPFTDVEDDAWYCGAVNYCFDKGWFRGTGSDSFTPDGIMTRAMFAAVLYRIAGEPEVEGENPFTDVAAGAWYTDAVIWASGEKLIEGYGGGLFGTNDPVTREQMVTLLWRYCGRPAAESADLSNFTDADEISSWARDAFTWAVSVGIVRGRGGGILAPRGLATRAEAAQIVMNYGTKLG